jgi:hypothetical protein
VQKLTRNNYIKAIIMSHLRIYLFLIFFFKLTSASSQCDTLKLRANYTTFADTLPEYYGKFQVTESSLPAILRLDGKEKNIMLPHTFSYDSLGFKQPHAKLMTLRADKSKCVYFMNLQASNYKIDIAGTGTGTSIGVTYTYFDKIDTLLGTYIPPPPIVTDTMKIDSTVIDTVIYGDINFYFPTLFSPNNDYINDEFRVFATENVLIDRIEIYDRWGNSRYQRRNIFSDEITFGSNEKVQQGDLYVGYLIFRNKIIKRFEFSVVEN